MEMPLVFVQRLISDRAATAVQLYFIYSSCSVYLVSFLGVGVDARKVFDKEVVELWLDGVEENADVLFSVGSSSRKYPEMRDLRVGV